jgi:Cu-Zn family superoxide dismutase
MNPRRRGAILGGLLAITGVLAVGSGAVASAGHAEARLIDVDGRSVGWARFTEDATGTLHVSVHVKGLSAGLHGIHLHAVGACTLGTATAFSSAGAHHNPLGRTHGLSSLTGSHAGDLPNLVVNRARIGHLNGKTDLATLSSGPTSLFDPDGSAVIIHAAEDDQVTNPTGNSGARIACGVITAG